MKSNQEKGRLGEDWAIDFLKQKGYQIVARNYRAGRGELDIISTTDDLLVFVEVKFRTSDCFGTPENNLSPNQQQQILQTAEDYIFENDWNGDIRFDIIAIIHNDQLTDIQHFEDAFY